jgi:ubiquinone/menaquinone biosynthesis C-methylase UbiE
MKNTERAYLPAAGHDWALPFYDPLVRLIGADAARKALLFQAALHPTHRVLDIGCGTGTLAIETKRKFPNAYVAGLDPDPRALARARKKAARAGVSIRFDQGFSDELPYPNCSFDRVFSSFMFHHLHEEDRARTLREVRRVLVPGGSLHLADVARPEEDEQGWKARMLRSNPHLKDNAQSRVLQLLGETFKSSKQVATRAMLFGLARVAYYEASAS